MNVVVTGASRGIGLELTQLALTGGHQVLAVAREPQKSAGLERLHQQFPKTLEMVAADLTHPEAPAKIAAAVKPWPQVDLLINNAGILRTGESVDDFMASFQVNSVSPFLVTQGLLPQLKRSKEPKVVHVTSLMGSIEDNTSGGYYAYRASKAALNMINKSLCCDHDWLTTIVIHPGWVKTDMGGSNAPVEPRDSAQGIWRELTGLKHLDSGKFFDFKGKHLPW